MKSQTSTRGLTRRHFLKHSALISAGVTFLPGHILGLNGANPPSEKVNIAGIGVAGQGASDLGNFTDQNIVALCDVDWRHAAGTFKKFPNAKQYKDYRRMLDEQKDIDAVVVATPDHVHAFASMRALKLGKHVYCEKPLTHSVWEARQIGEAARQSKLATQMGNQGQASEETRRLCEYMSADAIGPVREVHLWTDRPSNGLFKEYWPQGVPRPKESMPVPDTLDWDLWLGPAPQRPYHEIYLPFRWRGWWDFGTGALGDIGCHSFDPIFRALKLGHPISVEATSSRFNEDTYPLASIVRYKFPARGNMPALTFNWYDGGLKPERPDGLEDGREFGSNGRMLIGDKGILLGNRLVPEAKMKDFKEPPQTLKRSPGHYKEWIQAIQGGDKAGSNFDFAGPLAEVVLLGNIALRASLREELTHKRLLWDGPNLRFTNCAEANNYLRREYRQGWEL
jgi:predicted dehydrogenase